jgi:hypothetical protein
MTEDLFGNEITDIAPAAPSKPRPVVNDMTAVMTVLGHAVDDFGYLLAGSSRRVMRKNDKTTMRPVPAWEANVVHQLLDSGQLTIGGTHFMRCGAVSGQAHSVLVPKSTRLQLDRWRALKIPSAWNTRTA